MVFQFTSARHFLTCHPGLSTSASEGHSHFSDDNVDEKQSEVSLQAMHGEPQTTLGDMGLDGHAQDGVKRAEALTQVWSTRSLGSAYAIMFLLSFINAFQTSITHNLTPYVLSSFAAHSLIPTIEVATSVMRAVTFLPLAKVVDLWGRPLGLLSMTLIATLGLVMMAATRNIEMYAAAQVRQPVTDTVTLTKHK